MPFLLVDCKVWPDSDLSPISGVCVFAKLVLRQIILGLDCHALGRVFAAFVRNLAQSLLVYRHDG